MTGQPGWICPKDNDPSCRGHCPRCQDNQIGGGGANGMFCVNCGHCWQEEGFLDDFLGQVDAPELGKL